MLFVLFLRYGKRKKKDIWFLRLCYSALTVKYRGGDSDKCSLKVQAVKQSASEKRATSREGLEVRLSSCLFGADAGTHNIKGFSLFSSAANYTDTCECFDLSGVRKGPPDQNFQMELPWPMRMKNNSSVAQLWDTKGREKGRETDSKSIWQESLCLCHSTVRSR